jgi:2'-5' RNA ligase
VSAAVLSSEPRPIRAFFAFELDERVRGAAAEVAVALRAKQPRDEVRWVRPENYHVTLRFLGNIDPAGVSELTAQVASEVRSQAPFEVQVGSSLPFPRANKPRAVVLSLEPEEPIVKLAAAVERGVVAFGLRAEKRRFRSHLTLGRTSRSAETRCPDFRADAPAEARFPVREVVLFRSELRATGSNRSSPTYTALERISLGASDHPISTLMEN